MQRFPFDPEVAARTKYPITTYQPVYFVADSFEDASMRVKRFAETFRRASPIHYDPYTCSMTLLDNMDSIKMLSNHITTDTALLNSALQKVE